MSATGAQQAPKKRRRSASPRSSSGGLMNPEQRRYAVAGVLIILGVYVAPLVLAVVTIPALIPLKNGLEGSFAEGLPELLAGFYVELILGQGPISQAPSVLLPLLAALTVATLWSPSHRRVTRAAVMISAAGMLAAVILHYLLVNENVAFNLVHFREDLLDHPDVTGDEAPALLFEAAKGRYVTKALQDLATVLAILLGVKVIPGRSDDNA